MEDNSIDAKLEADSYLLKAQLILSEAQTNLQICGSSGGYEGNTPPNIDLAIQYIDRCLEHFPENPIYLNLKALLIWEGYGNREEALPLATKAALLAPRDIDIQNNLKTIRDSPTVPRTRQTSVFGTTDALAIGGAGAAGAIASELAGACFIATAAYGRADNDSVYALRQWRDQRLSNSKLGRMLISVYYRYSPRAAQWIARSERRRAAARLAIEPLAQFAKNQIKKP